MKEQFVSDLSSYFNQFPSIVQTMEDEETIPAFARMTNIASVWKLSVATDELISHVFISNANYENFEE